MKMRAWYLALLFWMAGLPAIAQTQDAGNTATGDKTTTPTKRDVASTTRKKPEDAKTPKKVWTNDDVEVLKGGVSVVGAKEAAEAGPDYIENKDGPDSDLRRERIQQYRGAIANLRKQIEDADKRIVKLRNFRAEDSSPSGGINPNQEYDMVPLEEQVKQLEARKKQLQGKIGDLEDQARKEGIEPGEVR